MSTLAAAAAALVPPSTGKKPDGPVPMPHPIPYPGNDVYPYPHGYPPYPRGYRRNMVPWWLYDRYGNAPLEQFPQTIIVQTPAKEVATPTPTAVAAAAPTPTSALSTDAVTTFANLWPLLLSIAASLILVIAIFSAIMYISRMISSSFAPKPQIVYSTIAPQSSAGMVALPPQEQQQ